MTADGGGAGQLALDLGHRPAMGERDLVVTGGNRLAVDWLDRWPAWPAPALAIHGPPGCGKTHLTMVFRARSGAPALTAATLDRIDPLHLLTAAPAVALDGADLVAGRRCLERGLLHLMNLAAEMRRSLLLTGHQPPARWSVLLPDLGSRLAALPTVAVLDPDDAALAAVLAKLFRDRQLELTDTVIPFLLARMERRFAAALAVVAWLDQASLARHRPITIALAREALAVLGGADPAA